MSASANAGGPGRIALPVSLPGVGPHRDLNGWRLCQRLQSPIDGRDQIVAMVAVGLWGAFLAGQAMWLLPVGFPVLMAFGGALRVLGVPLPAVETGIE